MFPWCFLLQVSCLSPGISGQMLHSVIQMVSVFTCWGTWRHGKETPQLQVASLRLELSFRATQEGGLNKSWTCGFSRRTSGWKHGLKTGTGSAKSRLYSFKNQKQLCVVSKLPSWWWTVIIFLLKSKTAEARKQLRSKTMSMGFGLTLTSKNGPWQVTSQRPWP